MSCAAYRDFNNGKSGEIELYIAERNTFILFISWIHENIGNNGEFIDIGSQAIMRIKCNEKIDVYDAILIIFDKITKDYSHKLKNIPYKDYLIGTEIVNFATNYTTDNGQNAPAIQLTRDNSKYISKIKKTWKNNKIINGEIFENGEFIYEYPIVSTTSIHP